MCFCRDDENEYTKSILQHSRNLSALSFTLVGFVAFSFYVDMLTYIDTIVEYVYCILYIVIISDDCQWWGWMSLDYYYSSTRINTKLSCCKNKMDAINSSNRVKDRKESVFLCVRFDSFIASIRFTIIISHSHRDDTMSSFIYYGKYGECEYSYKMRSD